MRSDRFDPDGKLKRRAKKGERYDDLTLILRDAAHIDRFVANADHPPRSRNLTPCLVDSRSPAPAPPTILPLQSPGGVDWPAVLDVLRERLAPDEFVRWIEPLRYVGDRGNEPELAAPSEQHAAWTKDNYEGVIRDALGDVLGRPCGVRIVTQEVGG